MKNAYDAINIVNDLFEEAQEQFYLDESRLLKFSVFDDQPKNASWVSVEAAAIGLASLKNPTFGYEDAEDMQMEFIRLVKCFVSTELLQMLRSGDISEITVRIGPNATSSENLNLENGIEDLVYSE